MMKKNEFLDHMKQFSNEWLKGISKKPAKKKSKPRTKYFGYLSFSERMFSNIESIQKNPDYATKSKDEIVSIALDELNQKLFSEKNNSK